MVGHRHLIINADDLGLSPAVNRGIIELRRAGVVTSASLLMNLPATADALARAADCDLELGVHLNLTVGRPMGGLAAGLVDGAGYMVPVDQVLWRIATAQLSLKTIEHEWSAQVEAFLMTGRQPAHIDSHVHLHALPGCIDVIQRVASRYQIGIVRLRGHGLVLHQALPWLPARPLRGWRLGLTALGRQENLRTTDTLLVITAFGRWLNAARLVRLLRQLPPGVTELVTHAGYIDAELCRHDRLQSPRLQELHLLHDPRWLALLAETDIELIDFRSLARQSGASERPRTS